MRKGISLFNLDNSQAIMTNDKNNEEMFEININDAIAQCKTNPILSSMVKHQLVLNMQKNILQKEQTSI